MQFLCRMMGESGLSLTNNESRSHPEMMARLWLSVIRYGLYSAKDSATPYLCFRYWALKRTILWPHPHVTRLLNLKSDLKTWNRDLLPLPHSWPISFTYDFTPLTSDNMILALWSLSSVRGYSAVQAPLFSELALILISQDSSLLPAHCSLFVHASKQTLVQFSNIKVREKTKTKQSNKKTLGGLQDWQINIFQSTRSWGRHQWSSGHFILFCHKIKSEIWDLIQNQKFEWELTPLLEIQYLGEYLKWNWNKT